MANYIKTGTPAPNMSDKSSSDQEQAYKDMIGAFRKVKAAKVSEQERNELIFKGNQIFNEGDLKKAHIIFSAINYYSGMVRVAKKYYEQGNILEAFAIFKHAGATKEVEKLAEEIAMSIKHMLKSE